MIKHAAAFLLGCLLVLLGATPVVAGKVTYIYTDQQGSPLIEADAQGNVLQRFDYKPYGGASDLWAPADGPGYTGHVNDPETGLIYMQARYQDPAVGRFLSVDPAEPEAGDVFAFNRYAYANNNPYRFTDPDGRATVYRYADKIVVVQTYVNHGTQFSDDQIKAQGANLGGQTSDGKTVEVRFVTGSDKDAVHLNANPKLDDTSPNGANRSHTER